MIWVYITCSYIFNVLDAVNFEFLGCFCTWPLVLNSCIQYLITLVDYLFKGPIMPLGIGCNKYGGKQKCWECNSLWVCADHYGYWGHRWFTGACYQHSGAFLGKPRQQYKVHMYLWSCSFSVSLWVRLFKGGSCQFPVKASDWESFPLGGLVSSGCEEYVRHVDIWYMHLFFHWLQICCT